jgi:hypothetical protein
VRHARPVGVAQLAHHGARAALELRERQQRARAHAPVAVRNRVTVRVLVRVADQPVDRVQDPAADRVLEHLGVGVHLGPVEPQHAHQEGLEDAVAPHHLERAQAPGGGESRARTRRVRHEPGRCELAEHVRHRRRGEREPLRESRRRHGPALGRERVERLQVVLLRARELGRRLPAVRAGLHRALRGTRDTLHGMPPLSLRTRGRN